MSITIKYVYRRHNTWIYRRAYPKHLQGVLGFAFKQSLKTIEATEAKVRVAALNQTYHAIITEAEANAKYTNRTHNNTGSKTDNNSQRAVQLPVPRPRFGRVRLLGDVQLAPLADRYLVQMSERLRPGSWKAVRFAITLLTSQLGQNPIGSLSWSDGANTPEHFTATLVGHHTARSANKLTYGLYSAGISPAQKRQIIDGIRLPEGSS